MIKSSSMKLALVAALMTAGSVAMAADDVASNITALQTAVLAMIGLAVTAGFAVLAASLTPDIGMAITKKWIKKGAK